MIYHISSRKLSSLNMCHSLYAKWGVHTTVLNHKCSTSFAFVPESHKSEKIKRGLFPRETILSHKPCEKNKHDTGVSQAKHHHKGRYIFKLVCSLGVHMKYSVSSV